MKVKHLILIIVSLVVIYLVTLPKPDPIQTPNNSKIDSLQTLIDSLTNLEKQVDTLYRDSIIIIEKERESIKEFSIDSLISYIKSHYDSVTIYKTNVDSLNIVTDSLSLSKWGNTLVDNKSLSMELSRCNTITLLKDQRIDYLNNMFHVSDSINSELRLENVSLNSELDTWKSKAKRRGIVAIALGVTTVLLVR